MLKIKYIVLFCNNLHQAKYLEFIHGDKKST